ncbi:MAG: hypothetical protein AAF621_05905, partial [Pseudomonadota bacterium]
YTVIKIEGLPEKMLNGRVFYNEGAYFIAGQSIDALEFDRLSDLKENANITVSLYGEDTGKPLKNILFALQAEKAAPVKKAVKKKVVKAKNTTSQRKKSA